MRRSFPRPRARLSLRRCSPSSSLFPRPFSSSSPPPEQPEGTLSPLKRRSQTLTGDPAVHPSLSGSLIKTASARGNMRAAGFKSSDFTKPLVTVAVPWTNVMPCNVHLWKLAGMVAESVEALGGKPVLAMTPAISDGVGFPWFPLLLVSFLCSRSHAPIWPSPPSRPPLHTRLPMATRPCATL